MAPAPADSGRWAVRLPGWHVHAYGGDQLPLLHNRAGGGRRLRRRGGLGERPDEPVIRPPARGSQPPGHGASLGGAHVRPRDPGPSRPRDAVYVAGPGHARSHQSHRARAQHPATGHGGGAGRRHTNCRRAHACGVTVAGAGLVPERGGHLVVVVAPGTPRPPAAGRWLPPAEPGRRLAGPALTGQARSGPAGSTGQLDLPAGPVSWTRQLDPNTSRNSSSPWFWVVTNPAKLGLLMPHSANGTLICPATLMPVPVRSACSGKVTV